jgi:hypothetical protein
VSIREVENTLQVYDLSEIIEKNDLTEADVLLFLVEQGFLELPDPEPLDFSDD